MTANTLKYDILVTLFTREQCRNQVLVSAKLSTTVCGKEIQFQDSSKRKYKVSQPLWECVVGCRECSHLIWIRMGDNQGKYQNLTHFLPLSSLLRVTLVMRLWPWIPANSMHGTSLLGNRIGWNMRDKWKEIGEDILQVTSLTSHVHSLAFNFLT